MGFDMKTWGNPIALDANNLNRIEQGIKNSHDTLEIVSEEVSNLQNRQLLITEELNTLIKDTPNIIETLTKLSSLLENNDISAVLSSADNFLMKTKQTLTDSELKQIYKNLNLNNFLKLTAIKVNDKDVVNGSEVNITLPKIDTTLDINSTNAISNSAVAKALQNIDIDVEVPTHLNQLQQDVDHLTVSAREKAKWNSYEDILNNISVEETDPTVPAWAKAPDKPLYYYEEILNTPDIPSTEGFVQNTIKVAGIDLKDDITTTELSTALNLSQYANKVTSVNGKTGAVSLGAGDVGALPNTTVIPKLYNDFGDNLDGAISQGVVTEVLQVLDNAITSLEGDVQGKYTKPSTGIPKTDLASDVQTSLDDIANKANQSNLDATNVNVSANTTIINTKGGLYRGTFDTWDLVPTDISGYNQDNNGNTTPLQNDYIVLNNGSGKLDDSSFIYQPNTTGGGASIANTYNGVTQTVVYYNVTGSANAKTLNNVVSVYYNSNTGKWVVTTLIDCIFNDTSYSANDIIAEWGYSSYHEGHIKYSANAENGGILVYNGVWNTNGKDGWNVMLSTNNMSYSTLNAIKSNTNAIGNIETSLETLSNSLSSSLTTLQTAIANKFIIRRWA